MIPKKLALGLDPRVDPGFRKRSCSSMNLERDDESKRSHHALGSSVLFPEPHYPRERTRVPAPRVPGALVYLPGRRIDHWAARRLRHAGTMCRRGGKIVPLTHRVTRHSITMYRRAKEARMPFAKVYVPAGTLTP